MALNMTETRTMFQNELDKQMMEGLTSSFMDANAGDIIYNGGAEVKIPSISMDGLKEYSRTDGYPSGGVSLSYQTLKMTMDRGASFMLDAMDVNESNFVASAGAVMGEFQRMHVIPEVDAYRYSSIYKRMAEDMPAGVVSKTLTAANIYSSLVDDIGAVRDECGENTDLVVIMNGRIRTLLGKSTEFVKNMGQADFRSGSITTKVKTIEECPVIQVPSSRMYSKYTFYKGDETAVDGETTVNIGEKGGFEKAADAKLMNYIILPRRAAIAVCKQDKGKIITPDVNQKADAWLVAYRRFHDLWIRNSMLAAIRVSVGTV